MPAAFHQACSRSEEHTSELQSHVNLVCRLLLEKKKRHLIGLPHYATLAKGPMIRQVFTNSLMLSFMYLPIALSACLVVSILLFFNNNTTTTEIYTLSLHDALPI